MMRRLSMARQGGGLTLYTLMGVVAWLIWRRRSWRARRWGCSCCCPIRAG